MDETKIVVRPAIASDLGFVFLTWLESNYGGSSYFHQIPRDIYCKEYALFINRVLEHKDTAITVACSEESPNWLGGFAVMNASKLYWVYVRDGFRSKGIASLMLKDQSIQEVKATSKIGRTIIEKKNLIFNPF